jgi:hypothetical protein
MTADLITRNLQDQSANLGAELLVQNQNGSRKFVNARTGEIVERAFTAAAYDLQNSPLDNSFQLDPASYAVSKALFEQPGVPEDLSNLMGGIVAVTAKSERTGAAQLFKNNLMAHELIENVNFFRTAHSQVGVNQGSSQAPYLNNLILGAKILNQTG